MKPLEELPFIVSLLASLPTMLLVFVLSLLPLRTGTWLLGKITSRRSQIESHLTLRQPDTSTAAGPAAYRPIAMSLLSGITRPREGRPPL